MQYMEDGAGRGSEGNVAMPGVMRSADARMNPMGLGVFPGNQGQGQVGGSMSTGHMPPGVSNGKCHFKISRFFPKIGVLVLLYAWGGGGGGGGGARGACVYCWQVAVYLAPAVGNLMFVWYTKERCMDCVLYLSAVSLV